MLTTLLETIRDWINAAFAIFQAKLDKKQDVMQFRTMPAASEEYWTKTILYTGQTGGGFVQGFPYYCKKVDGSNPAEYEWVKSLGKGVDFNNLVLTAAQSLVLKMGNISQLNTRISDIGVPNQMTIYIAENSSYYTITSRGENDTEDECIFVGTNQKLVPLVTPENKLNIKCLGGVSGNKSTASRVAAAIKLCMKYNYTLFVPSGEFYVTEEIEITNSFVIEGVTTYGIQNLGSRIIFDPEANDKTLFTDNGRHNVSIKHINFICKYTTQTHDWTDPQSSPSSHYLTWSYTYTGVNCLYLKNSYLYIDDVFIKGFSGYGLCCNRAHRIHNVSIGTGLYGFFNCLTDTMFDQCFVQGTEYGWYWNNGGSVILAYNIWADQCKYAFYAEPDSSNSTSGGNLSGLITGEIDHCLYAAVFANLAYSGLTIRGRIRRCGLYYLGTDMSTIANATFSWDNFVDMSKGVYFAIRFGRVFLDVDTDQAKVSDNGSGVFTNPTVLAFGQVWYKGVINMIDDLGDNTLITTDKSNTRVTIINYKNKYLSKTDSIPTASASNVGKTYLYTGTTTATYQKGGIYECQQTLSDTYEWKLVNVPVAVVKDVVANSTDFADFKSKIALL